MQSYAETVAYEARQRMKFVAIWMAASMLSALIAGIFFQFGFNYIGAGCSAVCALSLMALMTSYLS